MKTIGQLVSFCLVLQLGETFDQQSLPLLVIYTPVVHLLSNCLVLEEEEDEEEGGWGA